MHRTGHCFEGGGALWGIGGGGAVTGGGGGGATATLIRGVTETATGRATGAAACGEGMTTLFPQAGQLICRPAHWTSHAICCEQWGHENLISLIIAVG